MKDNIFKMLCNLIVIPGLHNIKLSGKIELMPIINKLLKHKKVTLVDVKESIIEANISNQAVIVDMKTVTEEMIKSIKSKNPQTIICIGDDSDNN